MMKTGQHTPMRIAHIAGGLTTGGVEAVIHNYSKHLPGGARELVYISYDTPLPEAQARFEALGFTVYAVTKKRDNFIRSCREVCAILKRHEINIVHSHMTLMCFVTSLLALCCGVSVRVAHAHLALRPAGTRRLIAALCRFLTKRSSTHWLACGRDAGAFLYGARALRRGRVVVLNNAVEPERYAFRPEGREALRAAHGVGARLCVGHAGRFTQQKNHAFLLEAFCELHRRRPDSVLLLLGEGPLRADIQTRAHELGLSDAVIFTGPVDDVGAYYSAMDLFVLPSLYEGLAVVLVEVQCAALPALVSDTVTREIDLTGRLSYLPLEQARWVEAMCAAQPLPASGRALPAGAMRAAGFDIHTEAEKLERLYTGALAGARPGAKPASAGEALP